MHPLEAYHHAAEEFRALRAKQELAEGVSQNTQSRMTLDSLTVERVGEEIHIRAAARSFLHHQVRSMVGCLALVGRGRWSPGDVKAALEAKDRQALGLNAPPDGLYFVEALYP